MNMINIKKTIYWKTLKQAEWRWLLDMMYNILFIALIYAGSMITEIMLSTTGISKVSEKISTFAQPTQEDIQLMMGELNKAVNIIFIIIAATVLYYIISYSITEYLVYKNVYRKRFNKTTFWKYLLFNIITMAISAAAIITIIQTLKETAALIILPILLAALFYAYSIFNHTYFIQQKISKAIKTAYMITITNTASAAKAAAMMILTLIAVYIPLSLVKQFTGIGWLYMLIFIAWLMFNRYYIKNILETKHINKASKR